LRDRAHTEERVIGLAQDPIRSSRQPTRRHRQVPEHGGQVVAQTGKFRKRNKRVLTREFGIVPEGGRALG
jgi:hypothetical protein